MRTIILFLTVLLFAGCSNPSGGESLAEAPTGSTVSSEPVSSEPVPSESGAISLDISTSPELKGLQLHSDGSFTQSDGPWRTVLLGQEVRVESNGELQVSVERDRPDRWMVKDAQGNRLLKVTKRDDGSYKVVGADEQLLVKLKPRENGWRVSDSNEETFLKINSYPDNRVKAKDKSGKELFVLRTTNRADTVAWLSTEALSVPARLGLATATWNL